MKKFAVLAASLAAVSILALLTSCAGEKTHFAGEKFNFDVENINFAVTDTGEITGGTKSGDHHDLSRNGAIRLKGEPDGGNMFIETEMMKTNSCEISVKNNGEGSVKVYLYSEENDETPIREMYVDAGKTKSFDGLTSSLVYRIAASAADAAVDITVGD